FLARWLKPNGRVHIGDLATGAGDIPCMIAEWAHARDIKIKIDAVDQQSGTIEIARRLGASYPEITFVNHNLFDWNPAESYDIVLLSLALHHFSDNDAVKVLRKCRELSRGAVLISDLRRARAFGSRPDHGSVAPGTSGINPCCTRTSSYRRRSCGQHFCESAAV